MKEIQLTRGKVAFVDDEDFDNLSKFSWHCKKCASDLFYAVRSINLHGKIKNISMHREVFGLVRSIDHIDGNGLNNQKINLRECNHAQNMQNRRKLSVSSSPYKGVQWWKNQNRWASRIALNKKRIFLGYFINEIDAAKAYNKAATRLFGEFANLNKI